MNLQKLTKAEEEIMQIIWELGPSTVSDVRSYIAEQLGPEKTAAQHHIHHHPDTGKKGVFGS